MKNYNYFDTPDYEDSWKKIFFVTKWGLLSSGLLTVVDAVAIRVPKTPSALVVRASSIMFPWTSCLIVGSASQYMIAKFRGNKDGPLNYFLGGLLAGSVYGFKSYSFTRALTVGIFLGLSACFIKHANVNNYRIFFGAPYDYSESYMWGGGEKGDLTFGLKVTDPGRRAF